MEAMLWTWNGLFVLKVASFQSFWGGGYFEQYEELTDNAHLLGSNIPL